MNSFRPLRGPRSHDHGPQGRTPGGSPAGALLLLAAGWAGLLLGCDSSNPVIPESPTTPPTAASALTLTVTSSPAQLEAGAAEPATITVSAVQASDGEPPPDGTTVALNTDLGNFGTDNQGNPTTLVSLSLRGGTASASFFAGDVLGTANLLAQSGDSSGQLRLPIVESTAEVFFLLEVQPNIGNPEGGDTVVIQGEGFVGPLRVTFGSALAQVLEITSSRTIVVETPPSVTPVQPGGSLLVDVSVTNTLDVADPPTATLPGAFTYAFDAPPPFFVLEVVPNVGGPDGGETVSIRGGGFRGEVRVEFGGKNGRNASLVSSQEIRVITPSPPSPVPAGSNLPVDVAVFHALDEEIPDSATLLGGYTYVGSRVPDPPGVIVVESLSVTSGDYQGGTSVTATGQGFASPASVELAGIQQSSVTVTSETSLTFVTAGITLDSCPASGQVPQMGVTVTNLDTSASGTAAGLTFTYTVTQPRIDSLSRNTGRQVGGQNVTISGAGFESPVRVVLVGSTASFAGTVSNDSSTSITFVTPRLPDTFFPTVDCITSTGQTGQRFSEAAVGIQVINQGSDCSDTLEGAFTVLPATTGCRATGEPPNLPQCNDGLDNDGDGLIDFSPFSPGDGGDPECASVDDNDESQ